MEAYTTFKCKIFIKKVTKEGELHDPDYPLTLKQIKEALEAGDVQDLKFAMPLSGDNEPTIYMEL